MLSLLLNISTKILYISWYIISQVRIIFVFTCAIIIIGSMSSIERWQKLPAWSHKHIWPLTKTIISCIDFGLINSPSNKSPAGFVYWRTPASVITRFDGSWTNVRRGRGKGCTDAQINQRIDERRVFAKLNPR